MATVHLTGHAVVGQSVAPGEVAFSDAKAGDLMVATVKGAATPPPGWRVMLEGGGVVVMYRRLTDDDMLEGGGVMVVTPMDLERIRVFR